MEEVRCAWKRSGVSGSGQVRCEWKRLGGRGEVEEVRCVWKRSGVSGRDEVSGRGDVCVKEVKWKR